MWSSVQEKLGSDWTHLFLRKAWTYGRCKIVASRRAPHLRDGGNTYYPCYDGNGNVIGLINADNGTVVARYEYGPYEQVLTSTGNYADSNPFRFSTRYTDLETGLVYFGSRYYSPLLERWVNRDLLEETDGTNPYSYAHGDPVNFGDLLGFLDYKLGSDDPVIREDPGAGAWNSEPQTRTMAILKRLIQAGIWTVWIGMPDAVNHLSHYFGNSGSDYTIRLQAMIDDVPSAARAYKRELDDAMNYIETLPNGNYQITSGTPSSPYSQKSESWNWYYAVGGYSAWGKGSVTICNGQYTLKFEYKSADKYNWDAGKFVTIAGITITDEFMGEFHRQGYAKEFKMNGSIKKTVSWKKGQTAVITDGW